MSVAKRLQIRSNNQCELCTSANNLGVYDVPPDAQQREEDSIWVCEKCTAQLNNKEELDVAHWACLNESMWSEVPAVQVVSWRMLQRLKAQTWAMEAIDMMYFDEETMAWAKATGEHENTTEVLFHRDSNGHILQNGDKVVLIKSLDVKGSTVNARLGTVVHNIRLVADNTDQIEGKIEGQTIVILTKYLRKG